MKLSRILGLLAVLLILPLTLALQDGGVRVTVANAECSAVTGNCCFALGLWCHGGEEPQFNHYYDENGCDKP